MVLGVALLAGCTTTTANTDDPADVAGAASTATPSEAAPPKAEYDGPRVPDGSWSRVATLAQAERRGLERAVVLPHLGPDRRMPVAFVVDGNTWTVLITEDDGVTLVGDVGTLTYDGQGRLLTTSQSEGCPGCEGLLEWKLTGDALRMWFATGAPAADDARLVHEGTFRRAR